MDPGGLPLRTFLLSNPIQSPPYTIGRLTSALRVTITWVTMELIKARQAGDADEEPQQVAIKYQLSWMDTVVEEMEKRLQLAESKHWNLLIWSIGAASTTQPNNFASQYRPDLPAFGPCGLPGG